MALEGDFRTVRSFDNTRLSYATWGDGPTLMLVSGFACSNAYWTFLVPYLVNAGFRVVFYDHRGHGRSGLPGNPNEVSVPSLARDLWVVADASGTDKPVLLGHSMGVQVVLEAYRLAPHRVAGLIACAGPFEHPFDGPTIVSPRKYVLGLLGAIEPSPWMARAAWSLMARDPRLPGIVGRITRMVGRLAPADIMDQYFTQASRIDPVFLMRLAHGIQHHSARDLLPDVDARTLILSGEHDVMTPSRVQREMAALMPDATLEVFDESGHTFPVDEVARFNERITTFMHEIHDNLVASDTTPRQKRSPAPRTQVLRSDRASKAHKVSVPNPTT